jgi:serine/threonine-protein kinase
MDPKATLDAAIDAIADERSVDWDALERDASSAVDRELLMYLHVLAEIGQLHRSVNEPPEQAVTREAPAQPVRHWGRYALREKVGEGSFGSVFRAWDGQLEREVAVKLFQSRIFDSSSSQILAEARAIARIRHDNVVKIFSVEAHDDVEGLCMEFIHGTTLEDFLTPHGVLSAEEAGLIGRDVGRALAAVHGAGFIHRDVKARNVMREANGRIVLMDFGTGRELVRESGGGLAGTPVYMAPELFTGSPASQKSDIYSLGVLLYYLVTGSYPTEGRTFGEVAAAHERGEHVPLVKRRPDLPDRFIQVVDRAIAANPDERFESAAELVHQLVAVERPEGIRATTRTVGQRIASAAAVIASATVAVTLLGVITSLAFNVTLERTDFAGESLLDWIVWGLRSLIGPIGNVAQVLLVVYLVVLLLRLARRLVAADGHSWGRRAQQLRRQLGFTSPTGFAQWAFVIALTYLVVVCIVHWRLVAALPQFISTMTADDLRAFSPDNKAQQLAYRSSFDWLVLGTAWALLRMRRMRREAGGTLDAAPVAALALTLLVGATLWVAPYRLWFQSERPRIQLNGQRCYDLGRRGGEVLVYCPDAAQPKVHRVPAADPGLHDTGITESVFTLQ